MYKKIIMIIACSYVFADFLQASQAQTGSSLKKFDEQMNSFTAQAESFVAHLAANLTEAEKTSQTTQQILREAIVAVQQTRIKLDALYNKDEATQIYCCIS